jgi:hypothetical protein
MSQLYAIIPVVSKSNYSPTAEQAAALSAFATGDNVVLEAGAGTGKTSTLQLMAESTDKRGLYLAYNKAIQLEAAARFPSNVECRTAHSLAYGPIVASTPAFKARMNAKRISINDLANRLGVQGSIPLDDEETLDRRDITRLASRAVDSFCQSADAEITSFHVPFIAMASKTTMERIKATVLPIARQMWDDLSSITGTLPWGKKGFGYYLKLYQLSNPVLRKYDFILFDEAQDANPVIDAIVTSQTCQKIMVGDRSQAIYGWNGAIDAMSKFEAPHRLPLTQSFRFGQTIADEANKWLSLLDANLDGVAFRLSGNAQIQSTVAPVAVLDVILCRTNAGVLENALSYIEQGQKVAIVGGAAELAAFARAAESLMRNENPDHPDLGAFKTWTEACEYSETDDGKDLKVMVRLITLHGTGAILSLADSTVREDDADVVVSTVHKAKGREWDTVRIHNDFPEPKEDEATGIKVVSRTDAMLAYVAVTRAKLVLDNVGLSWVNDLV